MRAKIVDGVIFEPRGAFDFLTFFDGYVKIACLLSLGVLFDASDAEIAPLSEIITNAGGRDWHLEFLISRGTTGSNDFACLFPTPYGILRELVVGQSNQVQRQGMIKDYLVKQWYAGHKDCYWYYNHLGRHDTYFGYWSFESAAVVKILVIDDSSFRDSPYYPKDLL